MGVSQNLTPAARLASTQRIEMIAFSLPFIIKGLKALKVKSDRNSKGLLKQPPLTESEADDDDNDDSSGLDN